MSPFSLCTGEWQLRLPDEQAVKALKTLLKKNPHTRPEDGLLMVAPGQFNSAGVEITKPSDIDDAQQLSELK